MDLLKRLLANSKSDNKGCLVWTGTVATNGYAYVYINRKGYYIHRVMYELVHEPIPNGMVVCHTCDVKLCINPDHLAVGTQAENLLDMKKKGRRKDVHWCILTEDDVKYIRSSAMRNIELARKFNVAENTISNIRKGINWKGANDA